MLKDRVLFIIAILFLWLVLSGVIAESTALSYIPKKKNGVEEIANCEAFSAFYWYVDGDKYTGIRHGYYKELDTDKWGDTTLYKEGESY